MYWKRLITTCFGLGWLPVAPGTWGSLPPALVFGVLTYCRVPAMATTVVMAAMLIVGCAACVWCSSASVAATGRTDPGEVVMDEFAGQAVAFLVLPLAAPRNLGGWESVVVAGFGFFMFRFFDILKPGPIRRLERLPGGWGILADDLVAGLASAVCAYIATRVLVLG